MNGQRRTPTNRSDWRLTRIVAFSALLTACAQPEPGPASSGASTAPSPAASVVPKAAASPTGGSAKTASRSGAAPTGDAGDHRSTAAGVTIMAGGDVSFGRLRGQLLLQDPKRDDFAPLAELFRGVDLRFVNLESQLSDQGGQTVSPINKLVFTGPPAGADVLARGGIDIVSIANNHAWDYGQDALVQTIENLDRVGVAYVGATRTAGQPLEPRIIERKGVRIAFIAVTDIWNQGLLRNHEARDQVAGADPDGLAEAVRRARSSDKADAVVVSYHGGYEYVDTPHEASRALLRRAIEAGADVVFGHHPHVVQRIEFVGDRPIFYSLGNLLMRMSSGQPWTEWGLLARVRLGGKQRPQAAVCPFRIFGLDPVPLARDELRKQHEAFFRFRFEQLLKVAGKLNPATEATLGPFGSDGCATVRPTKR